MKISLAMIVAPTPEEAKKLNRALLSVKEHVDEIVITEAGPKPCKEVKEVAERYGAKLSFFKWVDDFAAARNFNFSQATGDWILWLDADDILSGGDKLRDYADLAEKHNVDGYAFLYHYGYDDYGNLTETHWKTQFIKNDGHAQWVGAIHEDLIPQRHANWASVKDIVRVHKSTKKENASHFMRNLAILEKETEKNPDEPRNWFYLARTKLGIGAYGDAIEAANRYLELSNWDQERYEARLIQGEAFMRRGEHKMALTAYSDAILEYEHAPDAYVYKARMYVLDEKWAEALLNLEIAGSLKGKGVMENPTLMKRDVPSLACLCLIHLKRFREAHEMAKIAMEGGRTADIQDLYKTTKQLVADEALIEKYVSLAQSLNTDGIKHLLKSVPNRIADDLRIVKLRNTVTEPTIWKNKSVAIYCGMSVEAWDGNSVKQGGIGGSETAVIELGKRLVSRGWDVTVYNWCNAPAEGTVIDGVRYMNYWQLDRRDSFDVLWLWRSPGFLDVDWKARKIIVDLHDVTNPLDWTPRRIEKVDHIFVKSAYHRSLYPNVPNEKFVIVGNGISLERFDGEKKKEPNRFVYTSTPNRGLENILDVWPQIREAIPGATLHVYYGWNTFAAAEKDNPTAMAWMRTMQEKMQQDGIVDHGRVNQNELAEDLKRSTLWLYPTEFPEIHCITALEMQAARVYPITTGYAALAETQQSGVKIPGDPKTPEWRKTFVDTVITAARSNFAAQLDMGEKYAESCSWEKVAHVWDTTLCSTK